MSIYKVFKIEISFVDYYIEIFSLVFVGCLFIYEQCIIQIPRYLINHIALVESGDWFSKSMCIVIAAIFVKKNPRHDFSISREKSDIF